MDQPRAQGGLAGRLRGVVVLEGGGAAVRVDGAVFLRRARGAGAVCGEPDEVDLNRRVRAGRTLKADIERDESGGVGCARGEGDDGLQGRARRDDARSRYILVAQSDSRSDARELALCEGVFVRLAGHPGADVAQCRDDRAALHEADTATAPGAAGPGIAARSGEGWRPAAPSRTDRWVAVASCHRDIGVACHDSFPISARIRSTTGSSSGRPA